MSKEAGVLPDAKAPPSSYPSPLALRVGGACNGGGGRPGSEPLVKLGVDRSLAATVVPVATGKNSSASEAMSLESYDT